MPLFGLGVLILWLGWFGFNPGSTLNALDGRFAEILFITNLAAAAGVLGAVATAWLKTKAIDIGMAGNGAIAGLVAITAPSGYVEIWAAPIIGAVAGVIVVLGVYAIDKVIDDPVGALSAHGLAGIWGTISCGIFTAPRLAQYNAFGDPDGGLWYSGQFTQLVAQVRRVLDRLRVRVLDQLRDVLADQEDVWPPRHRGRGGRRPRHLRARDVRLPGAVHPAARVPGRFGTRAGRLARRLPATATAMSAERPAET